MTRLRHDPLVSVDTGAGDLVPRSGGARLAVNGRFVHRPVTGVERFARNTLLGLQLDFDLLAPTPATAQGLPGHVWEQTVLPRRADRRPLLNLCNFGPIAVRDQLVVLHDAAVFDHPEWFSRQYRTLVRATWPRMASRAKVLATVSSWSAERLSHALGVPVGRFMVITPGADALVRHPAPSAEHTAVEVLPERRRLVVLGSQEPRKNLPRLLAAWELASDRLPGDVWLTVVGGRAQGVFTADSNPGTHRLPTRVETVGRLDDALLREVLLGSLGLIYVPLYEGFGLPPLEAAALGTPCMVSDIPPLRASMGPGAHFVDPMDVDSIARGLRRLLDDPRGRPPSLPRWRDTSQQLAEIICSHWDVVESHRHATPRPRQRADGRSFPPR